MGCGKVEGENVNWLDGPCTTQLFGVPCFWIARVAKSGQFLSAMVIVVEIIGKDRVEASGMRLHELMKKLSESRWVQKQQQRRSKLVERIAVVFFPFAVLRVLSEVGVNLPPPLMSIVTIGTSIGVGVMVVLQWIHILLMLVDSGTRMIVRTLEHRQLSALITISAVLVLVISFMLDLAVS
jgi:hypothetical protein